MDFKQTPESLAKTRCCFTLYREIQILSKKTDIFNMKETIEKTIERLTGESRMRKSTFREHIRHAELKEILGKIEKQQDQLDFASVAMQEAGRIICERIIRERIDSAERNSRIVDSVDDSWEDYSEEADLEKEISLLIQRYTDLVILCIDCELKLTDLLGKFMCILNPQRQPSRAKPHNPNPTQYLLNSVDCYHRYMKFVGKAKQNSGRATLHVASAPGLSPFLLDKIIELLDPQLSTSTQTTGGSLAPMVHFYLRKDNIIPQKCKENTCRNAMASANAWILYKSAEKYQQQIYVSDNKDKRYFHTKWAAIVTKGSDAVDLLLTSACLIDAHMTPDHKQPQIYNSMIVGRISRAEFEQRFLNPMILPANNPICKPATIVLSSNSNLQLYYQQQSTDEALAQQMTTLNVDDDVTDPPKPGNYSPLKVYNQVIEFAKEADRLAFGEPYPTISLFGVAPYVQHGGYAWITIKEIAAKALQEERRLKVLLFADKKAYHCKFLAYGPINADGDYEVLMTSANIHDQHMTQDNYRQLEWTLRLRLTNIDFKHMLGQCIGADNVDDHC